MKRLLELADEINEIHNELVRLREVERAYIELQKQFSAFLHGTLDFQHKNATNLLKLGLAADPEKLAELFKERT